MSKMNRKIMSSMQSTFVLSQKNIKQKWLIIDAKDISLGRVASRVAYMLKGKHKANYAYNLDNGDYVIVINASQIKLTGKKSTDKMYYSHTGYPGGIKEVSYGQLRENNPEKMVKIAVKRMLSNSPLGRDHIKKLKVYADENHPHKANKPEVVTL